MQSLLTMLACTPTKDSDVPLIAKICVICDFTLSHKIHRSDRQGMTTYQYDTLQSAVMSSKTKWPGEVEPTVHGASRVQLSSFVKIDE